MFLNEPKTSTAPVPSGGIKRDAGEILKILLISFAIVVPVRYFLVQPFIVRGASMEPTFYNQEYLIIDEVSYYFREPARGETIVFRYPRDPSQYFIKRIIGLPGESVEISSGRVTIYNADSPAGFLLEEPYFSSGSAVTWPAMKVQLGRDEYFVMGDNRSASSDSRVWGPLKRNAVTGRAVFRAWPPGRFGVLTD